MSGLSWPPSPDELVDLQRKLGAASWEPWQWQGEPIALSGCFVCFARGAPGPGAAGDRGWSGAVLLRPERPAVEVAVSGHAGAGYEPGLLALREGPLLEAAVRHLPELPDVLLVDATGRDHPRRAGLALHLGAVLGIPTVGVTHRPLCATGAWPGSEAGARTSLLLDGELVGFWLRTRSGTRPIAVHAGWRTDPFLAAAVVLASVRASRTPEPLARARQAARTARALDTIAG